MGFEVSHLHVYIELAKLQWFDKVKDSKISKWIKESFDVKGSQYSVSKVRKQKQVKKYILKDGEYFAQGFTPEELLPFYKVSNKKGLDKMGLALADLEMDYMASKTDTVTFYEKYIKLKVDYGQNIYWNHCDAYITKMMFKKDKSKIRWYVSNRVDNFQR